MKKYNSQSSPKISPEQDDSKQESQLFQINQQQQKYNHFQAMLQNYLQSTQNMQENTMPLNDHSNCQNVTCSTGMISSLFHVVQNQTQSLQGLNKKVQQIVRRNNQLVKRVKQLEAQNQSLKSSDKKRDEPIMSWIEPINEIKIQGQSVSKQSLLQILFGKQKYEYKLKLAQPLDQPLYRERNFSIVMQLVDLNNKRVANSNKIPMSLALYTCQNPPKFIQKNTAGQKMLKGYFDQTLLMGMCLFQKVQIRQVTSHYRSGWIFLVAIPCMTPLGANKSDNFVDFTKIKPLVIDEVIVKAKKPKKIDCKKYESDESKQKQ